MRNDCLPQSSKINTKAISLCCFISMTKVTNLMRSIIHAPKLFNAPETLEHRDNVQRAINFQLNTQYIWTDMSISNFIVQ